jgi:hypothetical protein
MSKPDEKATHTNFIVFGLTQQSLESVIYQTRCEDATDKLKINYRIKIYMQRDIWRHILSQM